MGFCGSTGTSRPGDHTPNHGLIDLLRRWHLVWAGPARGLWNQGGQLGFQDSSLAQPLPFVGDHGIGEMPCAAGQIDWSLV